MFIALLTALAVNMRMAMYSAALVPHLGHAPLGLRALMAYLMVDQAFAVAARTYEDAPTMSREAKVAYYFGCMALICPIWYAFTLFGALIGDVIPPSLSLDFAVPICFIALLGPLLRKRGAFIGRGEFGSGLHRLRLAALEPRDHCRGPDRDGDRRPGGALGGALGGASARAEARRMIDPASFWIVTVLLGIGTFLIRFSFLGLIGGRELPGWATRHLRYVGVAVFPAIITPLVLWPDATGGETDPIRVAAALAALVAGVRVSVVAAIGAGLGTLYALQWGASLL